MVSAPAGRIVCGLLAAWLVPLAAAAQQPFYTDDADVTPRRRLHLEISNQFDVLKRAAYPNLRQNTAEFEIDYGLFAGVEVGVSMPLLVIFNAAGTQPRRAVGLGDTNIAVKYRLGDDVGSPRSFAVSVNLEVPTGRREQQLGSGIADFGFNSVWQQSVSGGVTLRANGGLIASGNTLTGVVGIPGRGLVVTGGVSVVRQMSPDLALGIEATGAFTPRTTGQDKAQAQLQAGGNWLLVEGITIDFGIVAGRFAASPLVGGQLGVSIDF